VKKYGNQFGQHPIGTGPFMFDKWVGNDLYLKRYPKYNWAPSIMSHKGPAYLSEIVIKEVPEASTRMDSLQTGEVDMTHFPVLSQVNQLEQQGYRVYRFNTPGFTWDFPINVTKAPTNDLRVRQAILYGINRPQIVRAIMFNQARVAYGPLAASTFSFDPKVKQYYPFNPQKAAALLDAAGWKKPSGGVRVKNGKKLHLDIIMFEGDVNKPVTELTQAMLAQLGFDVSVTVTNYDAFAALVTANKYNLSQMQWVALDPDQVMPTMFNSGQVTGGGQFNRTRIRSKLLDTLITQAGASSDPQVRTRLYSQIQIMCMKNAWIAPIFDGVWLTLTSKKVDGMQFDLEGRPLLYNVWLGK
jgi:peptide/nickel transport system substrate-binding protein